MQAPIFTANRADSQRIRVQSPRLRAEGQPATRCAGFTYLGLLIVFAVMGFSMVAATQVWQTVQKRDKEEELLFVGDQIRRAIGTYAATTARYPRRLEDLIKDSEFPGVRRYLRKIYRDPMTGRAEWGLVKAAGDTIVGVYSLSEGQPFKKSGFRLADQDFEGKNKYSEWIFLAKPAPGSPGAATPPSVPGSPGATPPPSIQGPPGTIAPPSSGAQPFEAAPTPAPGARRRR